VPVTVEADISHSQQAIEETVTQAALPLRFFTE
jgi:hypothetical protein